MHQQAACHLALGVHEDLLRDLGARPEPAGEAAAREAAAHTAGLEPSALEQPLHELAQVVRAGPAEARAAGVARVHGAEELLEDLLRVLHAHGLAGEAMPVEGRALAEAARAESVGGPVAVVGGALLRVAQDRVGLGDLLELGLCFLFVVRVSVW
eukprot:CAMPEP_0113676612 /NCGR_PEP_ID=MMETSP0038_2-20120614/8748_1 /TAXON_ID=2898 /ORGANISM="Cryptomonas paramecium" /LENGTH=154 /DNA_ID=CAMNT_0000593677 /DNA_START=822 /DNA_END=1284 /DNA_ORIENTATION=- /assembly_acc=CAM_ASM_000170